VTSIGDMAAELRGIARRLENMAPILRVVAADVRTKIDDSFNTVATPEGTPWDDLSEAALMGRARRARGFTTNRLIGPLPEGQRRRTAKRWTRRVAERVQNAVFNAKPLNDTARLRRSITTRVDARSMAFGTNVVYAAKQNFGDASNTFGGHPAPVPARRFLLLSPDGKSLAPADWWANQFARVSHWLITGEVT
jgi:phage gpG-like protein